MSEKKEKWSFLCWLVFLVISFVSMVKEGVIVPDAYAAIIFAFLAGWSGAKLRNTNGQLNTAASANAANVKSKSAVVQSMQLSHLPKKLN